MFLVLSFSATLLPFCFAAPAPIGAGAGVGGRGGKARDAQAWTACPWGLLA